MWKTEVLPTRAILVRDTYFQKVTGSGISACLSFCLESKSNTYYLVSKYLLVKFEFRLLNQLSYGLFRLTWTMVYSPC